MIDEIHEDRGIGLGMVRYGIALAWDSMVFRRRDGIAYR